MFKDITALWLRLDTSGRRDLALLLLASVAIGAALAKLGPLLDWLTTKNTGS